MNRDDLSIRDNRVTVMNRMPLKLTKELKRERKKKELKREIKS